MNSNIRTIFSAIFAAIILLVSSGAFAEGSGKRGSGYKNPFGEPGSNRGAPSSAPQTNRETRGVPGEIANNSQILPYLPKHLAQIHESRSACDADGRHTNTPLSMTGYSCADYRGNGLWRVVFGPGPRQGLRLARKVFKKEDSEWILLAEFDQDNQLVFESASGTKLRIASGGGQPGQSEPKQATGSSPIKIPDVGGLPLGTILNGIINKVR